MKFLLIDTDGVYTFQGCDNAVLCERTGYSSLEIRRIIASISFLRRVVLINFNVSSYNSRAVQLLEPDTAQTNILRKRLLHKCLETLTHFVLFKIFSPHQGKSRSCR